MLAMDAAVLAAYWLCVFTGPGFTTDYLAPQPVDADEPGPFGAHGAGLKEHSELRELQPAADPELGPELGFEPRGPEQRRVWEFCATCRVPKKWYAHHCFICNKCVIRMDHHCRRRG